MKIHSLRLAAFGPFAGEEYVDFDAFAADGLFLIEGRTGAGKSSILDAISYALFERAPRYGTAAPERLRSDHAGPADRTYVELTFSTAEGTFRVTRSPKYSRPKARGEGTTEQAATNVLAQRIDGEWVVLSTKGGETGARIHALVQLNADQFLQVILLAQNRFGEFLRAKSAERLPLLRTLFASARFDRFQGAAKAQTDALGAAQRDAVREEERLVAAVAELAPAGDASGAEDVEPGLSEAAADADADSAPVTALDPAWPEAQLGSALATSAAGIDRLGDLAAEADSAARTAQQTLAERERVVALCERRDRARAELAELVEAEPAIIAARTELDLAGRARAVTPAAEREERARAAQATASATAAEAAVSDISTADGAAHDPARLDDRLAELAESIGALTPVVAEEATLPGLVAAVDTARAAQIAAVQAVAAEAERQATLPETAARLRAERADALIAAAVLDAARRDAARAAEVLAATADLAVAEADLARLTEVRVGADGAHAAAAAQHRDLLDASLAGIAGSLAADLVSGEPCPVCGATAHPHPAERAETAVTEEDIAAAGERLERAAAALSEIGGELTAALGVLAGVRVRVAGRDAATAAAELAGAEAAVVAAESAERSALTLAEDIAAIETELDLAAETLATLAATERTAVDAHVAARSALERTQERVDEHRGDHASVAERRAALDDLRSRLVRWREAERALEAARRELGEADRLYRDALVDHDFADAAAYVAACRDPVDTRALEARIGDHDTRLAGVRARLAEPDLADLPEHGVAEAGDLADVAAARAAAQDAQAVRDAATSARVEAEHRHTALVRAIAALRSARDGAGAQREQYRRWAQLSDALAGGETNARRTSLESYVLAAELTKIVAEANIRLSAMTAGRFALALDDSLARRGAKSGLGLRIFDGHTGRARDTETLSGGETFLTSLALALGLAEVVTQGSGGVRLDTLFIDEGFGSLDSETLDVAMATLDGLRAGGRTVGVISHVPALQERIPARLRVRALPTGGSTIEHDAAELPNP